MSVYKIGANSVHADDPSLNEQLATAYAGKVRPLCLCIPAGVPMYIAKIDQARFLIKRMPNSGGQHSPSCDSYEPPPELSGLGQVLGSAIVENPDDATASLKFAFSLSKIGKRNTPVATGTEHDSVKADGNKLTLRGTLHYLWEQAGFNRWSPAMRDKQTMRDKRNWYVIRKFLLEHAEGKFAKGSELSRLLYIPESFRADAKDEINQRRMAQMMSIAASGNGARQLMLMIAEVKEFAPSRYGHKMVVKHLPLFHFMIADDLYKRLIRRFELEMGLVEALPGSHLIVIATFGIGPTGVASVEEMALMCVDEHWIPFESTYDHMLLSAMVDQERCFVKGMRYNLPSTSPLACAVMTDVGSSPVAAYIVPPGASDEYVAALDHLVEESDLAPWRWSPGNGEPLPPLPAPHSTSHR